MVETSKNLISIFDLFITTSKSMFFATILFAFGAALSLLAGFGVVSVLAFLEGWNRDNPIGPCYAPIWQCGVGEPPYWYFPLMAVGIGIMILGAYRIMLERRKVMLKSEVITGLNEHIDSVIRSLPSRKAEYSGQIETERQLLGFTDASSLRNSIVNSVNHDIRHESVMIFARNSGSRFPTDSETQEMGKLVERRITEIRSVVNALDWF